MGRHAVTTSYTDIMHRWFDRIWNEGDTSALDEYFAPDGVIEGIAPEPVIGPEAFRAFHKQFNEAIGDMRVHVGDIIEQDNKVAGHFTVTGVHKATGKPVTFTSHFFGHGKDGKMVWAANDVDYLGLLTQIGAVDSDIMEKAMA